MPATSVLYHGAVIRVADMAEKFADKFAAFRKYAEDISVMTVHTTKDEADQILNDIPAELEGHFRWVYHDQDLCFEMKIRQTKSNSTDTGDYIYDRISCHHGKKTGVKTLGYSGRTIMNALLNAFAKAGEVDERITYNLGLSFEHSWRYRHGMAGPTFDLLAAWVMANRETNPSFRPGAADEDYQPYLLPASKPIDAYAREELLQACRDGVARHGMPNTKEDAYYALPGDQGYVMLRMRYGHVYAKIIHPAFIWQVTGSDEMFNVELKSVLPDSMADALIGKPIDAVIDHPLLKHLTANVVRCQGSAGTTRIYTDIAVREEILVMPWSMKPTNS